LKRHDVALQENLLESCYIIIGIKFSMTSLLKHSLVFRQASIHGRAMTSIVDCCSFVRSTIQPGTPESA